MTKSDRKFVERITFYYVGATVWMIVGILGMVLGLGIQFYNPAFSGEQIVNNVLLLMSLGTFTTALIVLQALRIIKKLTRDTKKPSNNSQ